MRPEKNEVPKYVFKDVKFEGPVSFDRVTFNREKYLWRTINRNDLKIGSDKFVDIDSTKNVSHEKTALSYLAQEDQAAEIDNIAVQRTSISELGYQELAGEFPFLSEDADEDGEDTDEEQVEEVAPKIQKVLDIAKRNQRFVLLGEPGSGKTTSLEKILFDHCRLALNNEPNIQIPVMIRANLYDPFRGRSVVAMVGNKLGVNENEVRRLLSNGDLQLLIDAVNETDTRFQRSLYEEISDLLEEYDDTGFVISSRKFSYRLRYNLAEYELKELREKEVEQFIYNYIPDEANAKSLWEELSLPRRAELLELVRNPMMLAMLTRACRNTGKPPEGNGRSSIFRFFVLYILGNEYNKKIEGGSAPEGKSTFINNYVSLLRELAFGMKNLGKVRIHREDINQIFRTVERQDAFNKIEVMPIFRRNETLRAFSHESFLDYFAGAELAERIRKTFTGEEDNFFEIGILDIAEPQWYEAILVAGNILKDRAENEENPIKYNVWFVDALCLHGEDGGKITTPLKVDSITGESGAPKVIKIPHSRLNFFDPTVGNTFFIGSSLASKYWEVGSEEYLDLKRRLKNNLNLLVYNFIHADEKRDFIEDGKNLIKAIFALGDEELINTLFYREDVQQCWLSQRVLSFSEVEDIVKVCSKYSIVLNALRPDRVSEARKGILFNNNVYRNLRFVKIVAVSAVPVSLIKEIYLDLPGGDFFHLSSIGKSDPHFFVQHYQYDKWGAQSFVEAMSANVDMPVVSEKFYEILAKSIASGDKELSRILIKILLHSANNQRLWEEYGKDLVNSKFDDNVGLVFRVSWDKIPPVGQALLTERYEQQCGGEEQFKFYERLFTEGHGVEISFDLLIKTQPIDREACIYFSNDRYVGLGETRYLIRDVELFADDTSIGKMNRKSLKRNVHPFYQVNFLIKRVPFGTVSRKAKKVTFKIGDEVVEGDILERQPNQVIYNDFKKSADLRTRLVHPHFHPFSSRFKEYFSNKLRSQTSLKLARMIIMELNCLHVFHQQLTEVEYAMIVSSWGGRYSYCSPKSTRPYYFYDGREGLEGRFIIREMNGSVHLVKGPMKISEKINRYGYQESYIMRIDEVKNEGHIMKRDVSKRGYGIKKVDYYFRKSDCSKRPIVGDKVLFFPGRNTGVSSLGAPKAYDIYRLKKRGVGVISKIFHNRKSEYLDGYIYDSTVRKKFYFSMSIAYLNSLLPNDWRSGITEGLYFSYFPIPSQHHQYKNRVRICEFVPKK